MMRPRRPAPATTSQKGRCRRSSARSSRHDSNGERDHWRRLDSREQRPQRHSEHGRWQLHRPRCVQ